MNKISLILLYTFFLAKVVSLSCAQTAKEDVEKATKEAVERFTVDTKRNPKDANAWNGLGAALLFQGKTDEAIAAYRKAVEIKPATAILWVNLGKALLDSGKLDESISASRRAIELESEDVAAWANLGGALLKQGKLNKAYEATHKATGLGPANAPAWTNHGAVLLNSGKLDESIKASRRAIELDPTDAISWANLGGALLKQGKVAEAFTASDKATKLNPKSSIAWNNLAGALLSQDKPDEAVTALRKCIEIDPSDAETWGNLGGALAKADKLEEAVAALRKSINLNARHANGWSKLGEVLLSQNKLEESIKASQKAVEINPEKLSALGNLVKANGQANRIDRTGIWMARWVMALLDPAQAADETVILLEVTKGLQILKIEPSLETPTDSMIHAYYESHKNDFSDGSVHLQMISCPKATKVRKFMDELREKLVSGGDFGEAARKHSDDSAATDGGDRGWMKRSDLRADLADAAFALKIGKISPVIEDSTHYRILRIEERKSGSPAPLNEVKNRVIFKVKAASMEAKIRQWIVDARKELKESQIRQQQ